MKTDELIQLLSADLSPVSRRPVVEHYLRAIAAAVPVSALLMWTLLGLRVDLRDAVGLPMFWIKLALPTVLAAVGLVMVRRISVPGRRLGLWPVGVALPVLAMWSLAAARFHEVAPSQDLPLILGQTWSKCPWLIMLLAAPVFVAVFRAMRSLAPTRLHEAGAVAGLLSGSVGAMVYCLHCPEMEPAFLGTWYLLGIALTTAIGAWLGQTLLRW